MGSSFSSSTDSTTPEQELITHYTKEKFQQKSILLTGASRGLGRSIAHQLSKCNASLLILSGRDEAALNQVKEECLKIYQACQSNNEEIMKVETIVCDLADKHSVENLATLSLEIAKNHGRNSGVIDVLINNGGISSRSSFLETKLEVDEKLMQVNFFSGAALAKRLIPGMVERNKESGGRVIWISSVQGKGAFK